MGLKDYSREEMQRMPMIELAHIILTDNKKAVHYSELYDQVAEMKGFTEELKQDYLSQFYTDLTVDGRFITTGSGIWGLKRWYPIDQVEDGPKPKKKKTTKKKKATKKKKEEKVEEPEDHDDDLEVLTDNFEDEVHDDDHDEDYDDYDDEHDEDYDDEDDDDNEEKKK
ncbi:DNA-directed RNA polymerase subunit delta [Virgibacillus siamensis]|uniref:DNA-directed RNA polymerase subunit delta n=1 Tax=Virgibacillus siamensis TaxID=480071 RepID=UPI000987A899|nr:DNA-directed RNA polymerase subunit delta [Virgibacillus siamensis]